MGEIAPNPLDPMKRLRFRLLQKRNQEGQYPVFTDDQIRARAHGLANKHPWRSPEENWQDAKDALRKEYRCKALYSFWRWTGISEKKGWDLLTGLSIPIFVLVAGLMFNHLNSQHLLEVADNNQKDSVVREYIKEMKALLLSKEYPLLSPQAKGSKEAIIAARASTFIALAQLKGSEKERRNLVLLFLRESGLLDKRYNSAVFPKANLYEADLTEANLSGAFLNNAVLRTALLSGAWFAKAHLNGGDLRQADLTKAHLQQAGLQEADLKSADLRGADLRGANLRGADLRRANLSDANLKGAILNDADLREADLSRSDLAYVSWSPATQWPVKIRFKEHKNSPFAPEVIPLRK